MDGSASACCNITALKDSAMNRGIFGSLSIVAIWAATAFAQPPAIDAKSAEQAGQAEPGKLPATKVSPSKAGHQVFKADTRSSPVKPDANATPNVSLKPGEIP